MEILRNGVSITLTDEEVRNAYEVYLHECQVLDAKSAFKEWLNDVDYEFPDDERFEKRYGFTIAAAMNPLDSNYLIEKFVETFNKKFDTGNAERTIWYSAICSVMDDMPGKLQTYCVTYKEELYYRYDVKAHSQSEAEEIWHRENKAGNPDFQTDDPEEISFSGIYDVYLKETDEE